MPGEKQNENMHRREEEGEREGQREEGQGGERHTYTEKGFLLKTLQLLVPALSETQVCTLSLG